MSPNSTRILPSCFFCSLPCFSCLWLDWLFALLGKLIGDLFFFPNKTHFIYGCKYSKAHRQQCTVGNFVIGQAQLAVWKSCRLAAEGQDVNVFQLFTAMVESRKRVEHKFFQMTVHLLEFEFKWCVNGALLFLCEYGEICLLFFPFLFFSVLVLSI